METGTKPINGLGCDKDLEKVVFYTNPDKDRNTRLCVRVFDCVNVTMCKYTHRQSLYVDERDLAPRHNSCSLNTTQVAPMNICCCLVSNGCIKQIYGCHSREERRRARRCDRFAIMLMWKKIEERQKRWTECSCRRGVGEREKNHGGN